MAADLTKGSSEGFLKITDKITKEVLLEQKNAVHFGNLSAAIAKALAGDSDGHIKYVEFGNGGTSITELGTIFYRSPNVSVFALSRSSMTLRLIFPASRTKLT